MLAWILIGALLAGAAVYFALTPKDVDPDFIAHQASVAATRLPNESPIVRSLANPHGRALLGETSPLKDFRFCDVWADAASFEVRFVTKNGQVRPVDLAPAVHRVRAALSGYAPGARVSLRFGAGVEALIAFFAAVLNGQVPVLIDENEDFETNEGSVLSASRSGDILVKQANGEVVAAANVCDPAVGLELDSRILANPERENLPVLEHVHVYVPPRTGDQLKFGDEDAPEPVRTTTPLSEADLGTAIAAQLTALGTQHRWSHNDAVFVAPGPLTVYALVAMLTALSAKAALLFAEADPLLPATAVLQRAGVTVLVSDDEAMRTLVKRLDAHTALTWLDYGWRRLRLARGALSSPPMVREFQRVRLVHTASGADPYRWLSNGDVAALRVLTGTQVVHTYTPANGLAVSQTSVGDYRARAPGKEPVGVNWGPPLPGLELKKIGKHAAVRRANHAEFEQLPAHSAEDAVLRRDGCLYVPEKRHDFSEYYYYTGELN